MIKFKRLTPTATLPKRQTSGSAGFDLCADTGGKPTIIEFGRVTVIDTGIAMQIPEGYVGLVKPRSGLAFNYGVDTLAGVIDSDYRGEVKLMLTTETETHGTLFGKEIKVNHGERMAQIIFVPVLTEAIEVDEFDDQTERGENGFGHTGI